MSFVTLFTDASFDDKGGYIGWAAWARDDERIEKWSGWHQSPGQTSNYAEAVAVYQGIMRTVEAFNPTRLHVVTDCEGVIHILSGRRKTVESEWKSTFRELIFQKLKGVSLTVKHVKAHKGTDTPRQWVNDWVDQEASRQMRSARDCKK